MIFPARMKSRVMTLILLLLVSSGKTAAQIFEAEDMPIKTCGWAISGGWLLDVNGYVADTLTCSEDGLYSFLVRAKGGKASGEWPFMEVQVDNLVSGPVIVDKSSWDEYRLYGRIPAGRHQLSLAYVNNLGSRRLSLDRVTVSLSDADDELWLERLAGSIMMRFPAPWSYSIIDWQIEELMWGIAKMYEITGDDRYLNYVRSHLDGHFDSSGNIDIEMNDWIPGVLLLWLFEMTGEEHYLEAVRQGGEFVLNQYLRTGDGGFVHQTRFEDQLWVDSLGGLGRWLGMLGYLTGESRYFDEGVLQFSVHADRLQDETSGLFYHGWDEDGSAEWASLNGHLSPCFWARGNGWVIRGLVDFLEYLPVSHPGYGEMVEILNKLVNGLVEYQDEAGGLWYTVIDRGGDGLNYLEASGSTLFLYGIQKGINLGVLSSDLQPVADRANDGLYRKIYEKSSGEIIITGISEPTGPGDYDNYVTKSVRTGEDYAYGEGLFLQAKAEMKKIEQQDFFITDIGVRDVTDSSAVVFWTTNLLSRGQVEYGEDLNYGQITAYDPLVAKYHQAYLSGLRGNTTYHYRVRSTSLQGSVAISDDHSFKTNPGAELSFSDITVSSGFGGNPEAPLLGGHAVAFADITGNGFPDLYLTILTGQPAADALFINHGGGYFTEQAALRGVDDFDGGSHGACFADLNNNGNYDLLNGTTLTIDGTPGKNNIYLNTGNGYFVDITHQTALDTFYLPTRAIIAFDMEGDGDLDIFCVSNYLGSDDPPDEWNEFYRNEGNLVFTPIDTGAIIRAPAGQGATAVDFDNDGYVDVFAGNRTGPLNILKNDGKGNFSLINPITIGIHHQGREGVTFGDIDNDGNLDILLMGDEAGYFAYLYKNNGDGTFAFHHTFENINGYMGGFADVDNDGDLDLIFAGDDKCYLNDGYGNFFETVPIPVNGINDPRAISFADIDNDGDLDFAIACKRSTSFLFRNNLNNNNNWLKIELMAENGQAGAFGAKVFVYPGGDAGGALLGVRHAISNQGYLAQDDPVLHFGLGEEDDVDIIAIFPDGGRVVMERVTANQKIFIRSPGKPSTTFFTNIAKRARLEVGGMGTQGVCIVDVDRDNLPDIYLNNKENELLPSGYYQGNFLFRNEGNGTFSRIEQLAGVAYNASSAQASIFFDMDGDGDFDLAVANANDGLLRRGLFRNNGNGIFESIESIAGFQLTGDIGARSVVAGDINGDNHQDLFFSSRRGVDNEFYLGNGSGQFTRSFALNDKDRDISGMILADLDQDGNYEVLMGNLDSNDGIGYFKKGNNGSFVRVYGTGLPESGSVAGINVGDVNNDGYLDILVNGNRAGFSDLYTQTENQFMLAHSFPVFNDCPVGCVNTNGVIADFNNDGYLDIFLPMGQPRLWINDGAGNFAEVSDSSSGFDFENRDARYPAVLDFDGDGDLDIVVSQYQGPIKLFENNFATGNFLKFIIYGPEGDIGGFGTKVWMYHSGHLDDQEYLIGYQEAMAASGIAVQNEPVLHFGAGDILQADLKFQFSDGAIKHLTSVEVNQVITVMPDEYVFPSVAPVGPDSGVIGLAMEFNISGARNNFGHPLEYQFDWGDSVFSAWGDSTATHAYSDTGHYQIKARARCQLHPEIISDWSVPAIIWIRSLALTIIIQPDSSGKVLKNPHRFGYGYQDTVKIEAIPFSGYAFKCWEGDLEGDMAFEVVVIDQDKQIYAVFQKQVEIVVGPDSISGKTDGYKNQPLKFEARGASSNLNHQLEYQFDWGDGTLSYWGDSVRVKYYARSGSYSIRALARCKQHPDLRSNWSDSFRVEIKGCHLKVEVQPEDAGNVIVNPTLTEYAWGDEITTVVSVAPGFEFIHWGSDQDDTTRFKTITIHGDTTLIARFKSVSNVIEQVTEIPKQYRLHQNYPNPFNASCVVKYDLPRDDQVSIKIFDVQGREVYRLVDGFYRAGKYMIVWHSKDLQGQQVSSGVYLCRFETDKGGVENIKMILMK